MATYTDPFNGTVGASILGANWVNFRNTLGGLTGWKYATGGTSIDIDILGVSIGCRWTGGSVGASQFSEITLATASLISGSASYPTPEVRCSGAQGTAHCYQFSWTQGNWYISRVVNGTGTDLGSPISGAPNSLSIGDVLRVEAEDSGTVSTIRGYYNGALIGTRTYDHGGGALASGAPGFEGYVQNSGFRLESWSGGDLGGGGGHVRKILQLMGS
jgi:hypothetical protein